MQRSRSKEELEKFHADFIALHSSPSKKKFMLEFSQPVASTPTDGPAPSRLAPSVKRSLPPYDPSHRPLETTGQRAFQSYGQLPGCFLPETKHRNRKAPTHEYQEQMFLLWNVHGKKF